MVGQVPQGLRPLDGSAGYIVLSSLVWKELQQRRMTMPQGVEGIVCDMENPEGPLVSCNTWNGTFTGGREFRAKMLFVVSSTEPVRERSYAIELADRCGNIV